MVRITLAQLRVGDIVMIPRIAYTVTFMGRNVTSDPIHADVLMWRSPNTSSASYVCTQLLSTESIDRVFPYRQSLSGYLTLLGNCCIDPDLISSLYPIARMRFYAV